MASALMVKYTKVPQNYIPIKIKFWVTGKPCSSVFHEIPRKTVQQNRGQYYTVNLPRHFMAAIDLDILFYNPYITSFF